MYATQFVIGKIGIYQIGALPRFNTPNYVISQEQNQGNYEKSG